jgi:hypothetical protein
MFEGEDMWRLMQDQTLGIVPLVDLTGASGRCAAGWVLSLMALFREGAYK